MTLVIHSQSPPLTVDPHGVCRVSGSRVTLETLIHAFQRGATPEEIAQEFPSVPLADVYTAIAYYLQNLEEVEAYLRQAGAESSEILSQLRSRSSLAGLRQRLLARREHVNR